MQLSQIYTDAASHALLDEFGAIPHTSWLRPASAFAIFPIQTIRNFVRAVQDRADGLGDITVWHRFCFAARGDISQRVIEGLVANVAARKRLPLLDESIKVALCTIGRSFVGRSHLAATIVEVLTRQTKSHLLNSIHHTLRAKPLVGRTTILIDATASTPSFHSVPIGPHLRSLVAPPSPMQIKLSADRTFAPVQESQSPTQIDWNRLE